MATGVSTHQKAWQYIRALNATEEQLDAVAFDDNGRKMTYRQFFQRCDHYAEAFSAIGISEAAGSRVGIVGTISVKCIVAFFALNSMGVSVSFISADDLMATKWLLKAVETEAITDLLLPDTVARPDSVRIIMEHRDEYGIQNVIVLKTSKQTPCPTQRSRNMFRRNLKQLRNMPGVLYMKDLLREYAGMPIAYGSGANDEAAVIVHTSGTTKGTHKPIPLSDVALNTTGQRTIDDELFSSMRGNAVLQWMIMPSASFGLINQVFGPLALGCTLAVAHGIMDMFSKADDLFLCKKQKVNVLIGMSSTIDEARKHPDVDSLDLSTVDLVIIGGFASTTGQLKRLRKFLRKHGSNARIVNGYGLAECGASNIRSYYDGAIEADKGIGRPQSGVNARVQDEETGEFFRLEDGEHTGILYLNSPSNSGGRIGDTVFFEPELIEGEPYICTNDLVRVDDTGNLFFVGRGNRFYVNNEGMKFDAATVEAAVGSQKGIDECVSVACYEKLVTHDTVPILYVTLTKKGKKQKDAVAVVRRALRNAYVDKGSAVGNTLPWLCVIADELPHNTTGKVDVTRIQVEKTPGREYMVMGVERDGELANIRLTKTKKDGYNTQTLVPVGLPDDIRNDKIEQVIGLAKTLGPDFLPETVRLIAPQMEDALKNLAPQMNLKQKKPVWQPRPLLPLPWMMAR